MMSLHSKFCKVVSTPQSINVQYSYLLYTLALSTHPRITIGFPMQNAEGPNIAKLSKNREFFENQ